MTIWTPAPAAPASSWTADAGAVQSTLARTTVGLLARHQRGNSTYPFLLSQFQAPTGVTLSIDADRLRAVGSDGLQDRVIRRTGLATRGVGMVQAVMRVVSGGGNFNPALRVSSEAIPQHWIDALTSFGFAGAAGVREFVAGAQTVRNSVDSNNPAGTFRRVSVWVAPGEAGSTHDSGTSGAPGTRTVAPTDAGAVGDAGFLYGSGGNSPADTDELWYMAGRSVVVNGGASLAWTLQIRDAADVLIASAAANAGVATAHLDAATFPGPAKIQVRDSASVLLAELQPTDPTWGAGVWGGDVYTFIPGTAWSADAAPATTWSGFTPP